MRLYRAALCAAALLAGITRLAAQSPSEDRRWTAAAVLLGSESEDRLRLSQLNGAHAGGWMIRSPMTLSTDSLPRRSSLVGCNLRVAVSPPTVDMALNSAIPFERNDHGLWAGRGISTYATGGIRASCARVRIHLLPAIWFAENRAFALLAAGRPDRSGFASPFHSIVESSADIPIRFGSRPLLVFEPGQSVIEVDAGPVTFGFGSESQWWGPGIRNALVMSNHAAGVPHVSLRTRRPIESPIGSVEARWMIGALTESPYFDFDPSNDVRSLAGLIVAWRPAADSNLSVGALRVVYAPIGGIGALPARFLDPVARWGESADLRKATEGRAAEQMTGLFGRWIFPASSLEVYFEWARLVLPASLGSLLVAPQSTQGYTVGFQWLSGEPAFLDRVRFTTEFTQLEQLVRRRDQSPPQFYASPVVIQGYTQRGQVVGASIGPGSSSQWIAVDYLRRDNRIGAFAGRIRWDNDSYYGLPTGFSRFAHDVSLYAGLRGAWSPSAFHISAELLVESRLNYLFQNNFTGFEEDETFDVGNLSLRFSVSPRSRREPYVVSARRAATTTSSTVTPRMHDIAAQPRLR